MPTEILAVDTSDAFSTPDTVVAANSQLTVCIKDAAGPDLNSNARVEIQLKDDSGKYFTIAVLTGDNPAQVIAAAGTYRFHRIGPASCGVFSG